MTGEDNIGGLVGFNVYTITNSYYDIETSGQTDGVGQNYGTGDVEGKTTAEMKQRATFDGWDFTYTWGMSSEINNGYPYLLWPDVWDGKTDVSWYNSSQNEFIIMNAKELAGFAELVNEGTNFSGKTVTLGANILLNDITDWEDWENNPPAHSWTRIGYNEWDGGWNQLRNREFNGTFDGDGYIISGVYINNEIVNNTAAYQGLFGTTGSSSTIKNLGVTASYVKSAQGGVGLLAGTNNGNVTNSYCSNSKVLGAWFVGGLVGNNAGTINKSYASITVNGTGGSIGGLVGNNAKSIINSYAIGNVSGTDNIGGLVGFNETDDWSGNTATIVNSYATGNVSGTDFTGGLVGKNEGGTVSGSYYDTETSTQTGSGGGTGKTTMQMKNAATFDEWDFDNIWNVRSEINNGYPYFRWESDYTVTVAKGTGGGYYVAGETVTLTAATAPPWKDLKEWNISPEISFTEDGNKITFTMPAENVTATAVFESNERTDGIWNGEIDTDWYDDNPSRYEFIIMNAKELAGLAKLVNDGTENFSGKTVTLGANILLNDTEYWEQWADWPDEPPRNTWTPIGINPFTIDGNWSFLFQGTFDGNGHIISGVYINNTKEYQGLFCMLGNGSAIKNLGVTASYIKALGGVGSFAGQNLGTIRNSYSIATVTGNNSVGGLVGINFDHRQGNIINSYSTGTVSAIEYHAGGLVGYNNGKITNSYSVGEVIGNTGGLVGENGTNEYGTGAITGSYYDTDINGQDAAGKGEGKSTAEMKTESTFAGWDFNNTWGISGDKNNGYPHLQWKDDYLVTASNGTGSGYYYEGDEVTLEANAESSRQYFKRWEISPNVTEFLDGTDKTGETVKFAMPAEAVTATAIYGYYHDVILSSLGAVSASPNPAKEGDEVTVTITASPIGLTNYRIKWEYGDNIDEFTQTGTYTAKFTMPDEDVQITVVFASVYAVTADNGTGSGDYAEGETVVLASSMAGGGERFKEWDISSDVTFLDNTSIKDQIIKFKMPAGNVTATATYEPIPVAYHEISVSGSGGTVTPSKNSVEEGGQVTLTATPQEGYRFIRWNYSESITDFAKIGDFTAAFTMPNGAVQVQAVFVPIYAVTVTNGEGSGDYAEGETVVIAAGKAPEGQYFKEWSFSIGINAYDNVAVFEMPAEAVTATAIYEPIPVESNNQHLIEISLSDGGVVGTSKQLAEAGEQITITAYPNAGYYFLKWEYSESITMFSKTDGNSAIFIMPNEAVKIEAVFARVYRVTVANGEGSGEYAEGETVIIAAGKAPEGQYFKEWDFSPDGFEFEHNTDISDKMAAFKMPGQDLTATARYEDIPEGHNVIEIMRHAVEISSNGGTATTSKNTAEAGEPITLIATANPGYRFVKWEITPVIDFSGGTGTTDKITIITMPAEAVTAMAIFETTGYMLAKNNGNIYTVSKAATEHGVQKIIDLVKASARGSACSIQFGENGEELDIGTASIEFNGAGIPWGRVTLLGKIASSGNGMNGTIYLTNGASVESKADIRKTGIHAIRNNSDGRLTISGGAVSAANYAVSNSSSGTVAISDGSIKSANYAVSNNGTGDITVSGGHVSAADYAVLNNSAGTLTINGGHIEATAPGGIAVYNESKGAIVLGGSPDITGRLMRARPSASLSLGADFAPGEKTYTLDFSAYSNGMAAVADGKDFLANFALANKDWKLEENENDITVIEAENTPTLPTIANHSIMVQTKNKEITLQNLPPNSKIKLYNLQGRQVYSANPENPKILRIMVQTNGIYILKINTTALRVTVK